MGATVSKFISLFPIIALCSLFSIQTVSATEASASFGKCPNADVKVYAEIKEEIPFVCNAVKSTFSFLAKAGLSIQVPIEVYIVEDLMELPFSNHYYGMYDKRSKRVTVLSYNSCRECYKSSNFCGLRFCRKLYSSFVVHEIAHAVADANLNTKTRSTATQEYIAYTTQLSLLPDEIRQSILTKINNEGFDHESEITGLFYLLNPLVFAVKAYRHFLRPENGKIFYNKLITGECILDRGN